MNDLILRCALQNAVKYNGKAELNSVLGMIFAINNKFDRKQVIEEAKKIIKEVNKLSFNEQKKKLSELGEIKKESKKTRTYELENVKGKVVMRFAPNPNGAMTLGHSRVALWNWFFVQKYNGEYILRFDDTDPRLKVSLKEAYKWFIEDLKWIKIKPHKVAMASKRLKIYYKYAEKLIKKGYAYVDTLPVEKMRAMLSKGIISDERNESSDEVLKKWKKMFTKYKDGEAVLRIKTDITHPNPAVRDWIAFRIIRKGKHPLVKARVWPMLNFASAIDDYEFKVTHILRGSDLEISDIRQKYIYDYFGWKYPETRYNGKLLVSGIKSTSEAKELIEEGKLTGWDDPRLGTIKALRRRGFQSEAIVKFIKDAGFGKNDINVNISSLEACNKDIIDKKANRYFFIENPQKIKILYGNIKEVKVPLHPDFQERGFRKFKVKDEFYVQDDIIWDKDYRLMHLFNFKNNEVTSENYDPKIEAKLIHWLPVSKDLINVEVVMPDNTIKKGFGESELRKLKIDDIIQFERFAFCRADKKLKNKMIFYYTHT